MASNDQSMQDVAAGGPLDAPLLDNDDDMVMTKDEEAGVATSAANDGEDGVEPTPTTLCAEIGNLFKLAIPIFMMQCAWVAMNVTDSALLGHAGTE